MKRQSKNLATSLECRLSGYALAATAAGAGMLGFAQPAEAKIVYTPTHRVIQGGDPGITYLDLNHDRVADFKFQHWSVYNTDFQLATLSVLPSGGNGFRGYGGTGIFSFRFASALPARTRIGPNDRFISAHSNDLMLRASYGWGQWNDVKNRYLGFRFEIKGKTHYGWARLNVHTTPPNYAITAVLTGYAYETIPNKPIIAGKTHGKDVITLEPASLGHLARGSSAIPAWRQKEH